MWPHALLTQTITPAKSTCIQNDGYGNFLSSVGSDGTTLTAAADPSTNYAAPTAAATESYNYSLSYNAWLGVTQTTGANGEQMTMGYDTYGRPTYATSPFSYYGQGMLHILIRRRRLLLCGRRRRAGTASHIRSSTGWDARFRCRGATRRE